MSEKLVMLALFGEYVSLDTKRKIVQAVSDGGKVEESPQQRVTVSISEVQNQKLGDFATHTSL